MLASAAFAFGAEANARDWAPFIAPDMPQTRALFAELQRRSAEDLRRHGLELRFVALPEEGEKAFVARELAQRPRVIFATSLMSALWAKEATATIPIIFASVADPVRGGLVASLGRPGGNLTGFTYDIPVEGKQLELLTELAPSARRIGVIEDGNWLDERVTSQQLAEYEKAIGRKIRVFRAPDAAGLVKIVTSPEARDIDAWLVPVSNGAAQERRALAEAFRKARKPAVFGRSFFVDEGGLASYQEIVDAPMEIWHGMLRLILEGVPPGQIPVQRPKRFEMTLNAVAARELKLEIPPGLLRRADRVVVR